MSVLAFIKELALVTLAQMAALFAGIFIFGLLIHFVSHLMFKSIENACWNRGTYLVAWLGTPVHELGHVLFCVVFLHRIVAVRFFEPDPVTGTLGYVAHKWNHWNPWQVLGNLFINTGPLILGSAVLFALFYFLVPGGPPAWRSLLAGAVGIDNVNAVGGYLEVLKNSAVAVTRLIFQTANLGDWKFWLFSYLSICVAANMRLSLVDIKGSLSGLGCLTAVFLLVNGAVMAAGNGNRISFPLSASWLGAAYSLLTVALMMAVLGFVLTYVLAAIYVKIKHGCILKPL